MEQYVTITEGCARESIEFAWPAREKIGEGKYREVFRSGDFVLKILKHFRQKSRLVYHTQIPIAAYTRDHFGIADFNQHEFQNYQRLAEVATTRVRDCFTPVRWTGLYRNRSASLSDAVVNDDGSLAQPLARYSAISAPAFWETLDELEEFLLRSKLYFPDINGENILVQFRHGVPQPVFIDYKRLGGETYPCQIWLRCDAVIAAKMRRKFQRLRERFKPGVAA